MPHCIVEYSNTLLDRLSPADLLGTVHDVAEDSGLFAPAHIKSRAQSYDLFILDENISDFIHVTVRLHQGRSVSQKQHLSSEILQAVSELVLGSVSITVEIVEMDSAAYTKQVFEDEAHGG